jgi:hypothetical protein
MRVRVRETEDGYVLAADCDWLPGTYPTAQAAARAAWNMRHHGAPDDLTTPVISVDPEEIA